MFKVISTLGVFFAFFAATTATAGNPSLCARGGWATAQSASGASFASMQECAQAREVYQPTASISPAQVGAQERFTLTVSGFHANASSRIYFAITGEGPYWFYEPFYPTTAEGSFEIIFVFEACRQIDTGGDVTVDLTLTFVDSYGVHASAELTLC